jgi:antitoxin (DNA-binding transcriptional repressor) of toxin-antitoxin stability system
MDRVAAGDEVLITRRGKPRMRLSPVAPAPDSIWTSPAPPTPPLITATPRPRTPHTTPR